MVFLEVLFYLVGDNGELTICADDDAIFREMYEDAIELIHIVRSLGVHRAYEGIELFISVSHLYSIYRVVRTTLYWVPAVCFIT